MPKKMILTPSYHDLCLPVAKIPLALYIHFPWCVHKCPYCDFNSHPAPTIIPESAYLIALLNDFTEEVARLDAPRVVRSVFIGGGTPSLFTPDTVAALLQGIHAILPLAQDAEITLEANPGTVDQARFTGFRRAGVNRLSLGIQSFDDCALRALGRIHDGAEAHHAVQAVRAAGFDNFNLDLMFGLPNQTHAQAMRDVDIALDFAAPHISRYQLTLEPHTAFFQTPPTNLPDEDSLAEMHDDGHARLAAYGYAHYEVSAYAQAGGHCVHNLNYWQFGDYLAIGAGAHGKLSRHNGIFRYAKPAHPQSYLQRFANQGEGGRLRKLERTELCLEFMLNALRLTDGFTPTLFSARTGLSLAYLEPALHRAVELGWLEYQPTKIQPTQLGARFLNNVLELFCDDHPR